MAYADIFNTAEAENFQKMAFVATWMVAQDIISDSNASMERKDWAYKVMAERLNISARQLAFQMLRNPAVMAAGVNSTDQQMLIAYLERLNDLVLIG